MERTNSIAAAIVVVLIVQSLFLNGCRKDSNSNELALSKKQNQGALKVRDFNDFLKQFSATPEYQLSKIRFPLPFHYYDEDAEGDSLSTKYIQRQQWTYVDLTKSTNFGSPVSFQQQKLKDDQIQVIVKGLDSGVLLTYCFEVDGSDWSLVSITDKSN